MRYEGWSFFDGLRSSSAGTFEIISRETALEISALKVVGLSLVISRGDFDDAVQTHRLAKKLVAIKVMRFRRTSLFTADVLSEYLLRSRCPTDATGAFFCGTSDWRLPTILAFSGQTFLRFQDKLLFFTANAAPDRDRDAVGVGGSLEGRIKMISTS